MQKSRTQGKSVVISLARQIAAASALFSVVILVWLSAYPPAHELFHADAGHEDYGCVVKEFTIGQAYFLAPRIVLEPALATFERISCEANECLAEPVDYRLLPLCGPPERT